MVMDTLKRDHEEMHQRLVGLQNEKDRVSLCAYTIMQYRTESVLTQDKICSEVSKND